MTHGGPTRLTLHVASKDVLDPTTPLGWVAETMADLDYLYNILAIPDLVEQGRIASFSLEALDDSLLSRVFGDLAQVSNSRIRPLVPPTVQAQLETLQVGMSFTIQLSGLAKVIDALARIFDPARRSAKREDDRHREQMNQLEEEDRRTEVISRKLEVIERYIDDPRFDAIVREGLGISRPLPLLKNNMVRAARSTITDLERNEIEVIDVEVTDVEEPS